jgi:uncharacterized protein (TIGR04255 family)
LSAQRPTDLPEYKSPPLDEVAVGVQYAQAPRYASTDAGSVWELFKADYPNVQEQPPLEPSFETFGGANTPSFKLQLSNAPKRGRLWFVSDEQDHLIQFQDNRFLLNWRKRPTAQEYPRFEKISQAFEQNLDKLSDYFTEQHNHQLAINQAEITYINNIPIQNYSETSNWLAFLGFNNIDLENINVNFSEVITDDDDRPFARMIYTLQSVVSMDGKNKAILFSLAFRGTPRGSNISDAIEFIKEGRKMIVTRFTELTTESAHKEWEKI